MTATAQLLAGQATGGVAVRCTGAVLLYPLLEGDVVALSGVDLEIEAGEMLAVLGPSGTGKSTLLSLLCGLLRPSAGEVRVGEHDVGRMGPRERARLRATEVTLVPQGVQRSLLPYATAAENVLFATGPARRAGRALPWGPLELLEALGLAEVAGVEVRLLSGGERQRVAIAAGVATAPRLLCVDEPTSQLDTAARAAVVELLRLVNHQLGATVVVVTHDPAVAAAMPRTVTIRDGRVGAEGRHGEEYAVVGRDGSVQLPPDLLERFPPGSLVRLARLAHGVELVDPTWGGEGDPE